MRRIADNETILPRILRETMVALIRREGADLTSRQFAVFLICYVEEGPHTVRGLAERTRLPKPAVSRVLDRLGAIGLTRRVADPRDKRSVLVACTAEGFSFLKLVRGLLEEAAMVTLRDPDDETGEDEGGDDGEATTGTNGG
jgi:DNA-binding MarR family transcriptional regulator